MQQFTRKENFLLSNTLNCVPFLLQGQAVLIDLRNDCSVAGRIDNADGHMNIHLTEVVYINRLGQQYPFERTMIRERMIQQIQIPPNINMAQNIQEWCEKGCNRRPPRQNATKGKRNLKQKRTQERHKEILQEIARNRKESE